jgi:4'-phosphopantetheinyl transferase
MKTDENGISVRNTDGAGGRQPPSPDEVAVWLCRVESLEDADLAAMDSVLSEDERARRDRFVFAEDRRAFTAAHALLRTVLSRYGPLPPRAWCFDTALHGKPFLAPAQAGDPPLIFNLSHTRSVVACAVAVDARLGIDVQEPGRPADVRSIAERHFTTIERQLLTECPREEADVRFVEIWTLKEAYIKAVGMGLSLPLDSFGFSLGGASGLTFVCPADASRWQFWLAALSSTTRIAVAAAVERPDVPWRISWWNHDGSPASGVALLRHNAG